MEVNVTSGNIATFSSDALITAVNSGKMWFGNLDSVIRGVAGNLFHFQIKGERLIDGQVFFTQGNELNKGAFKNVIFVIDDLQQELHKVILPALQEAEKNKMTTVSIPTVRMGVMLGVVEKSEDEALEEMTKAVRMFKETNPSFVKTVSFVVYNNPGIEKNLKKKLATV